MAFDISFPFICRENSRRSGIPLFPTILRTQRFRLSCSSRMVGDKSGKLGLIRCNNFPEAAEISAMISDHSSNYYVGHRRHNLAGCQPSNKSISAYKSKWIALPTNDVTNFWSLLWHDHVFFCDIRNNQGRGKGEADYTYRDLDYSANQN